jgi:hydrogenase-4 component B
VKVVGLVLLGPPRSEVVVHEAPVAMVAPMVLLAGACVVLGAVPGLLLRPLAALAPWASGPDDAGAGVAAALAVPAGLALHLPGSGNLPTAALTGVLLALVVVLMLARGRRTAAPAPSWACGQVVGPELNWTSAGFTKPLRLVLMGVLRPQRKVVVRAAAGVVQQISYRGHVPQLIDEQLYRPVARRSLVMAAQARRLQSGSLGTYVGYLIGLVVLLLALARAGVLS